MAKEDTVGGRHRLPSDAHGAGAAKAIGQFAQAPANIRRRAAGERLRTRVQRAPDQQAQPRQLLLDLPRAPAENGLPVGAQVLDPRHPRAREADTSALTRARRPASEGVRNSALLATTPPG